MSFAPSITPPARQDINTPPADKEIAQVADRAKDIAGAASALENIGGLSPDAAKIAGKAQQAIGLANAVKNVAGTFPGSTKDNIPFDQLDTPTATEVAAANNKPLATDEVVTTAAGILSTRIVAGVSINGNPINEILSVQINQQLGSHDELKLRFFHDQVQAPGTMIMDGAEKLLGQVAEVELYDVNGISKEKLQHLFVIADVQLEQDALNEGVLYLTGYAPTWILDGAPHFETFYKKNLGTIVKESAGQALSQVKASLKADPAITDTLPFVCRYNESVWNFLKRLSAETGQWLYFNGKELVFGKPEAQSGTKIAYGHNCSRINMSLSAKPLQEGFFDYEADGHRPINAAAGQYSSNAGAYNQIAFNKSKELFGTTPSVANPYFLPAKQSLLETIGKNKSIQSAAGMYYVKGETTIHDLRVGLRVPVDMKRMDQTASHAPLCITSITHRWDITGKYSNTFEAIPASAEVPPAIAYQKPVTYPMLAQVIDNKDNQGRVRVQFLGWRQQGLPETDFIRVLTPDAGGGGDKVATNRGLVTIPEIGDQVYVDFEQGNPDRPFVTGSVFHGKVGIGGGNGNDGKSLTTKSGHTLIMNDGGGITLRDKTALNHIVVDGNNKVSVTGDGTVEMISKGNTITITSKDGKIEITSATTIDIKSPTINIGNGDTNTINLNAKTINISAKANNIMGKNHIAGGDTKIDGGNVFIN